MSSLPNNTAAVNALRNSFKIESAKARCQCGKWCPLADACLPVSGPVHQPYISVKEATGLNGASWAAFQYDPEAKRLYTLTNRWYDTPCAASEAALYHSTSTRSPLRLDLVEQHSGQTRIDWTAMEAKLAADLYAQGYAAYIDANDADQVNGRSFAHPVQQLGWDRAQADTERAFAEADAQLSTGTGLAWEDAPFLAEVL